MDVFEESEQLSRVPLFSKLDKAKLKLMAFTSERLSLADKEFLFHKGDHSDSAYLILEGNVELVVESESSEDKVVLELGKNTLTGEMGVITNSPRSASIRAAGAASVLKIDADTFMTLLSENFSMSLHVMRQLSEKLSADLEREVAAMNKSN